MKQIIYLFILCLISSMAFADDELLNDLISKYKFNASDPLGDSYGIYSPLEKDTPYELTTGVVGEAINCSAPTCTHDGFCDAGYCFSNSNECIVCDLADDCPDPYDCWNTGLSVCEPAFLWGCGHDPIDEVECGTNCFVESNTSCIPSNYSRISYYDEAFKLTDEFTFTGWVYPKAYDTTALNVFDNSGYDGGNFFGWNVRLFSGTSDGLEALIMDGAGLCDMKGGDLIPLNTWAKVTIVYSKSNQRVIGYINNTVAFNSTCSLDISFDSPSYQGFYMCDALGTTSDDFYGYLDEFAIINRTWSMAEVSHSYFSELGGVGFESNATVLSSCTPNWTCNGYTECNISDLQSCNSTIDNNSCGESYIGDYSEFSPQACDGSSPIIHLQNPSPDNTTVLTSPILNVIGNITNTNLTYIQYAIENSTSLLLFYTNNSLINKTFFDLAIQFNMSLFENGYYYYSAYVEDSVLNRDYINATFLLDVCHPSWVCSGYEMFNCSINNTERCNAATDINSCNITYDGDYSEFALSECDYCFPSASYSQTLCVNHLFEYNAFMLTWGSCCDLTKLASDCVYSFDFGDVNFTDSAYVNGSAYCSGDYQPTYRTSDIPSIMIDTAGGVGAGSAKLAVIIGILLSLTLASLVFLGITSYIKSKR